MKEASSNIRCTKKNSKKDIGKYEQIMMTNGSVNGHTQCSIPYEHKQCNIHQNQTHTHTHTDRDDK